MDRNRDWRKVSGGQADYYYYYYTIRRRYHRRNIRSYLFYLGLPFEYALRDGVFLCKLMNKLAPGIIPKINTTGGDYKMMDNISQYARV